MKKTYLLAGIGVGILALSAISVAFASGNNYAAWRSAMGGNGRGASAINEANFDEFSRMHRLMADGDYAGAQKIRTQLGMGQGQGRANGAGCARQGGDLQAGGCPMHNRGAANSGKNFIDTDKDGVCDHLEANK